MNRQSEVKPIPKKNNQTNKKTKTKPKTHTTTLFISLLYTFDLGYLDIYM